MAQHLPLWNLRDGRGMHATCSLRPAGAAWIVVVENGGTSWVWEQHRLMRTALARAEQVYDVFAEMGFTEPVH
jgi:hypothetical protein